MFRLAGVPALIPDLEGPDVLALDAVSYFAFAAALAALGPVRVVTAGAVTRSRGPAAASSASCGPRCC